MEKSLTEIAVLLYWKNVSFKEEWAFHENKCCCHIAITNLLGANSPIKLQETRLEPLLLR
jgi:hypothetical protein